VDWLIKNGLAGWLALYWSFSSGVGVKFAQFSSQWEARADTRGNVLLTNKKQGNLN
jgi:hypothetical protein